MGILSPLKRQQCLKKYNKELAGQTLSLEQWKAEQAAFVLSEELEQAAILYGDYIDDVNGKQEPIFLPDFSPNRWDYEDYLGRAVYVRRDLYEGVDWEKTSRRSGLKKVMENSVQVAEKASLPNVVHVRKIGRASCRERVCLRV